MAVAISVVATLGLVIGVGFLGRGVGPVESQATVGSNFDRPPAWPGRAWVIGERTVGWAELEASAGPAHCGWEAATMMFVGWPPGTASTTSAQARQFIRDPGGQIDSLYLRGSWARNPPLPTDASDSGYRYGAIKLFFAPSDEDQYAYLVAPADSERWPRSDPMTICL